MQNASRYINEFRCAKNDWPVYYPSISFESLRKSIRVYDSYEHFKQWDHSEKIKHNERLMTWDEKINIANLELILYLHIFISWIKWYIQKRKNNLNRVNTNITLI